LIIEELVGGIMKKLEIDILFAMGAFSDKELEKLQIKQLLSLIKKLNDHNIEDEKLMLELEELLDILKSIKSGNKSIKKAYKKTYHNLKEKIKKNYGIVEKGTYVQMGIGLGMCFGIAIGSAFTLYMSTSITVGMMFGMAIGSIFGRIKDKSIENEDKVY
jgi:hypothetical protein